MEARAGNSILDFETLFSDFLELLDGSGLMLVKLVIFRKSERKTLKSTVIQRQEGCRRGQSPNPQNSWWPVPLRLFRGDDGSRNHIPVCLSSCTEICGIMGKPNVCDDVDTRWHVISGALDVFWKRCLAQQTVTDLGINLSSNTCKFSWNHDACQNTSEMQDPVMGLQLFDTFQHMITCTRAYAIWSSQHHHFTLIHTRHCVRGWMIHEPHPHVPVKSHISQKRNILQTRYCISWPLIFMGHNFILQAPPNSHPFVWRV